MAIEVARERQLWRQTYRQGRPCTPLELVGAVSNRRGTTVRFRPDPDIFGTRARFRPTTLYPDGPLEKRICSVVLKSVGHVIRPSGWVGHFPLF